MDFGRAATESHRWTCQQWHKEGKNKLDRDLFDGSCRTCYNKCPINTWKTGLGSWKKASCATVEPTSVLGEMTTRMITDELVGPKIPRRSATGQFGT